MVRRRIVSTLALILTLVVAARGGLAADGDQHDLTGVWEFQTEASGRSTITRFTFKQQGGSLSGSTASGASIQGNVQIDKIEFRVPTLGGNSVYRGTIGDANQMRGEANLVATKGTWTAKRLADQAPETGKPDGHAEAVRRLQEFARLVEQGNLEAFSKYRSESFAPSFLLMPVARHVDFFLTMHDTTRGLAFDSIVEEGRDRATVRFQSKLTGRWLSLVARVEPTPPHRIVSLGARGAEPPKGAAKPKWRTDEEIRQELSELLQKLAEADVFSGAVLLARDGVPIFQGAYGTANKDFNAPNRIDTKFNLGSMNKMFTAVAVAQLVERGKLSYDDPLSKFLPEFPDPQSAQKIKVKHLLSHTAGLGSYFTKAWRDSSRALYRTVDDQLKRAAADEKLLFEPGSRHQYSNTGMLVAGKVIEVASGQDYYDYVRQNIYEPAGMTNTDCYELDKVNPNLAVGYQKHYDERGVSFRNNLFEHVMRGGPQGGGYSTVEDLLRFDRALRSGKLVGTEQVKLLLSPKPELHSPGYGYGFVIDQQQNIAGHSGGFIGISANLDIFLDTPWTAVAMSNYDRGTMLLEQVMRELVLSNLHASAAAGK